MRRLFVIMLISVICSHLWGQIIWHLEGPDALTAKGQTLCFHSLKECEETKGITGCGLRTDGYSTWLSYSKSDIHSASAYFALESFPNEYGAFIALKGNGHSVSVGADEQGRLTVIDDSTKICTVAEVKLKTFTWYKIGVSVYKKEVLFYVNNKKLFSLKKRLNVDEMMLGCGYYKETPQEFSLSSINGVIDEVSINNSDNSLLDISKRPCLSIPASRFAEDFNRPVFHLLPAANWTNETHGLIKYKGLYHIFNQKNASAITLRQINWGHFISSDLLHWEEQIPAISPDKDYDHAGIWSGHAIIDDAGKPMIIYTCGGDTTGVGLASPMDDSLLIWNKYEGNPVIKAPAPGYSRTDMRDQYVFKDNGCWYMIIGYGVDGNNAHGLLPLYKSDDLKHWTYLHPLYEGNPSVDATGIFWEMPCFIKIGDKYVLSVNRTPNKGIPARTQYWTGKFINERFVPDTPIPKNLEVINRLLSPSLWHDDNGDLVSMAIIPDEISGIANNIMGWAHTYSLPRVWTLKDDVIKQNPIEALKQLRDVKTNYWTSNITEKPLMINKIGHQLETDITFHIGDAKQIGITLCHNPLGCESSTILFNIESDSLIIDQTKSSMRKGIPNRVRKDFYHVAGDTLHLRLFIDGSMVEGFINDGDAFSTRIFPLYENSTEMKLFADGSTACASAVVYKLNSAKVKMNF